MSIQIFSPLTVNKNSSKVITAEFLTRGKRERGMEEEGTQKVLVSFFFIIIIVLSLT